MTLGLIHRQHIALLGFFAQLDRKVNRIMSQQDQIAADVTTLTAAFSSIAASTAATATAVALIGPEIAALQTAHPDLDLSSLDALATTATDTASAAAAEAAAVAALAPTPVDAPPAETPAPTA